MGRLDAETSGLCFFTDDSRLNRAIADPFEVEDERFQLAQNQKAVATASSASSQTEEAGDASFAGGDIDAKNAKIKIQATKTKKNRDFHEKEYIATLNVGPCMVDCECLCLLPLSPTKQARTAPQQANDALEAQPEHKKRLDLQAFHRDLQAALNGREVSARMFDAIAPRTELSCAGESADPRDRDAAAQAQTQAQAKTPPLQPCSDGDSADHVQASASPTPCTASADLAVESSNGASVGVGTVEQALGQLRPQLRTVAARHVTTLLTGTHGYAHTYDSTHVNGGGRTCAQSGAEPDEKERAVAVVEEAEAPNTNTTCCTKKASESDVSVIKYSTAKTESEEGVFSRARSGFSFQDRGRTHVCAPPKALEVVEVLLPTSATGPERAYQSRATRVTVQRVDLDEIPGEVPGKPKHDKAESPGEVKETEKDWKSVPVRVAVRVALSLRFLASARVRIVLTEGKNQQIRRLVKLCGSGAPVCGAAAINTDGQSREAPELSERSIKPAAPPKPKQPAGVKVKMAHLQRVSMCGGRLDLRLPGMNVEKMENTQTEPTVLSTNKGSRQGKQHAGEGREEQEDQAAYCRNSGELGYLRPGELRHLSAEEVAALLAVAGLE